MGMTDEGKDGKINEGKVEEHKDDADSNIDASPEAAVQVSGVDTGAGDDWASADNDNITDLGFAPEFPGVTNFVPTNNHPPPPPSETMPPPTRVGSENSLSRRVREGLAKARVAHLKAVSLRNASPLRSIGGIQTVVETKYIISSNLSSCFRTQVPFTIKVGIDR